MLDVLCLSGLLQARKVNSFDLSRVTTALSTAASACRIWNAIVMMSEGQSAVEQCVGFFGQVQCRALFSDNENGPDLESFVLQSHLTYITYLKAAREIGEWNS
jgi:hypothetical protein